MLFNLQADGPVPIYEQVVAQVIYAIASGAVAPGALIPSVRELAERLLVHPNTVARAFQELERAGVVKVQRGRGMEVTAEAPAACRIRREEILRDRLSRALREAADSGLSDDDLRRLVEKELNNCHRRRSEEKH
jgi:GntR family transcriptional regulator